MDTKKVKRKPLYWLMPLAFALPFAAGMCYAWARFAPQLENALNVALKMVVIP